MFRLLVAGGRDFYDYRFIENTLDDWLSSLEVDFADIYDKGLIVVHGDAPGVDRIAGAWASYNFFIPEPHAANWKEYGKAAGHIRNAEMISLGVDYAILFPGGRGTQDMKDQLVSSKISFREVLDTRPTTHI